MNLGGKVREAADRAEILEKVRCEMVSSILSAMSMGTILGGVQPPQEVAWPPLEAAQPPLELAHDLLEWWGEQGRWRRAGLATLSAVSWMDWRSSL